MATVRFVGRQKPYGYGTFISKNNYLREKDSLNFNASYSFGDPIQHLVVNDNIYNWDSTSNYTYLNGLTIAQARAGGQDSNSIWTTHHGFDSMGRIGAGSPAIGKGVNLSSFFSTDKDGNPRPNSGAWDMGAYEYGATEIQKSKIKMQNYPAPSLLPNPIRVVLLNQYLQMNKVLIVYDMAGKLMEAGTLQKSGLYFLKDAKNGMIYKVVAID